MTWNLNLELHLERRNGKTVAQSLLKAKIRTMYNLCPLNNQFPLWDSHGDATEITTADDHTINMWEKAVPASGKEEGGEGTRVVTNTTSAICFYSVKCMEAMNLG